MPSPNIILGQKINRNKLLQAKVFRRQQTEAESVLWQQLRRNQVSGLHFRCQQIIDGFIVDIFCHKARLIVELDGDIHVNQLEHDAERQSILESRGLRFLKFANGVVLSDVTGVIETIANVCKKQISNLTP